MESLRDIKAQGTLPFEMDGWMWFVLFFAVAIGAAILVLKYLKRKKELPIIAEKKISPDEQALKALDVLAGKAYPDFGKFKEYFFELSLILRSYLEKIFFIPVTEKTTEEFLFELGQQDILTEGQKETLKTFLQYSDLVKFAKEESSVSESRRAEGVVRKLSKETKKNDF